MPLDVALIYAEVADRYGNAQVVGTGYMDNLLGAAARQVVVQVDRVVETEVIRRNPDRTWFWRDARVVRAPFGTHPYSNAWMTTDEVALREFVEAGRAGGEDLGAWMDHHVFGAPDHEDYLERIGIRRLTELLV
jgi:glutaconate CoA-transferase subunit A